LVPNSVTLDKTEDLPTIVVNIINKYIIYTRLLTFTIEENLDVTRKIVSVIIIPECLL